MKEKIGSIIDKSVLREEKIEKVATISFDGEQFLVRLPKRISDVLDVKKGNKMRFIVNLKYIEKVNKKIMVGEIIE